MIENVAQAGMEPDYPGRVFEDRDKEDVEAMLEFVNASREKDENKEQLRNERRQVRHQRDQEDVLWKKQKLRWQKQKIKLSNISASQGYANEVV